MKRSNPLPNLGKQKFSHVSCGVRCLLIIHQKWKEISVRITSLNSQFKLSLFGGWSNYSLGKNQQSSESSSSNFYKWIRIVHYLIWVIDLWWATSWTRWHREIAMVTIVVSWDGLGRSACTPVTTFYLVCATPNFTIWRYVYNQRCVYLFITFLWYPCEQEKEKRQLNLIHKAEKYFLPLFHTEN